MRTFLVFAFSLVQTGHDFRKALAVGALKWPAFLPGLWPMERYRERLLIVVMSCAVVIVAELFYINWHRWIDARYFWVVRWVVFAGYMGGSVLSAKLWADGYGVPRQFPLVIAFPVIYVVLIARHTGWPWGRNPAKDLYEEMTIRED